MRERIKQTMASVFGVPAATIPDDAAANEFPEWDSMHHLELMLALEAEFGEHISTETIGELLSFRAIEAYLSVPRRAGRGDEV